MALNQIISSYLRVICEGCIKIPNPECPACRGTRFYLWDPKTLYCYSDKGEQIRYIDENGESVPVIRRPSPESQLLTPDAMLKAIELWVSENPVRKWKLLLDENGWQSCIWINRYKRSCIQIDEPDFNRCIERTYRQVEKIFAE